MGIMFNLIDTQEGVKADLVPINREPDYQVAFERRVRRTFTDAEGKSFDAWCAQPTDIIIGKLKAWTEGQSAKHPADIYSMLVFSLSGFSDLPIDFQAIDLEATRMGLPTVELWRELLSRARDEIDKRSKRE